MCLFILISIIIFPIEEVVTTTTPTPTSAAAATNTAAAAAAAATTSTEDEEEDHLMNHGDFGYSDDSVDVEETLTQDGDSVGSGGGENDHNHTLLPLNIPRSNLGKRRRPRDRSARNKKKKEKKKEEVATKKVKAAAEKDAVLVVTGGGFVNRTRKVARKNGALLTDAKVGEEKRTCLPDALRTFIHGHNSRNKPIVSAIREWFAARVVNGNDPDLKMATVYCEEKYGIQLVRQHGWDKSPKTLLGAKEGVYLVRLEITVKDMKPDFHFVTYNANKKELYDNNKNCDVHGIEESDLNNNEEAILVFHSFFPGATKIDVDRCDKAANFEGILVHTNINKPPPNYQQPIEGKRLCNGALYVNLFCGNAGCRCLHPLSVSEIPVSGRFDFFAFVNDRENACDWAPGKDPSTADAKIAEDGHREEDYGPGRFQDLSMEERKRYGFLVQTNTDKSLPKYLPPIEGKGAPKRLCSGALYVNHFCGRAKCHLFHPLSVNDIPVSEQVAFCAFVNDQTNACDWAQGKAPSTANDQSGTLSTPRVVPRPAQESFPSPPSAYTELFGDCGGSDDDY